jgi:protein involved in polysaccharide export with SLBB domain
VIVERIDPGAAGAQRTIEDRALDAAGLQSTVRDGDVVTLFKISQQFANAVTLRGNVAAPLRYPYQPGMKISDLIPEREALIRPEYYQSKNAMVQFESGTKISQGRVALEVRNLLEEVNWDYALVERLDAKAVRSTLIPFNLGRAVLNRDPRDDLELLPGDVVTVFGVNDVPVPMEKRTQFVKLGGEVMVPGLYQITPGERLPQLLQRAGGLTSNAFVYGVEFVRESTRRQQQANLDLAVRSFEADVAGTAATVLQNAEGSDKAGTAQGQIASQQLLLSRLKALKANGRIALDMDPMQPSLPELPLEDGDTITVPHQPSFIGVFGAVLAERSFIQRDSYMAGDYLKRAGLSRSADQDAIMIIRADGTIESDAQRANAVFSFGDGLLASKVYPGDSIFIPEKLDRESAYTKFIRGAKDWTAIMYQFGLGAAAIKTFRQ